MNIVPVKRTGALRFSLDWGARLLAGIGLLGWTCALSFAQSGKSLPESLAAPAVMQRADEVRAADLTAQLQAKLAEARLKLGQGTGTNLPPDATPTEALEYQHTLQSLARIYQLRLEDLASLQAAQQRLEDQRLAASAWTGFAEPGPYSVLVVDDLRDNVDTLTVRIEAAATGYKLADTLLAEAKADLAESERKLRLSGEQLETTSRPRADSRLSWDRTLEEVREREATALVGFYQTRRRVFEVGLAENREQQALAQRQLAVASRQVRFARTDLDRVLKNVAAEDREIEEELRAAEAAKEAQDNALTKAREELRQAQTAPPAAPEEAVARAARVRRLQGLFELRAAQAETCATHLSVLRDVEGVVKAQRNIWQVRFAVARDRDLKTLQDAYGQLVRFGKVIQSVKAFFAQQAEAAARAVASQQERLQNQAESPADPALARDLLQAYRQREQSYRRSSGSLVRIERLCRLWKASLDQDRLELPFADRVRDLFAESSTFLARLWQFELISVEDTIMVEGQRITGRRGVTVNKVVMAILILVAGLWLSNLLARTLERLAVKRFKVERNQAALIGRWARVALVCGLVLFSLISVRIPLTVFAFLGGALAIGLGFGAQTLLKNFISGIIILFERPFRVGDTLDIDSSKGRVTSIGIRSSVLQLSDGTETLFPNSTLLEHKLTNWTYSNQKVRFSILVGVAYGTDTRQTGRILTEEAERHGLVQKEPAPQALFQDFADSALTFELRYWVDVQQHDDAQIASDLRHMIAGSLAQHGIAIAFPQRDVHLDTTSQLRVQILPAPKKEGGP